MGRVSNRHEGDLGGIFRPFAETELATVTVVVAPHSAHLASVQHTTWMLINLLARLDSIVKQIGFVCPVGTLVQDNVVPFAQSEKDFRAAVLQGASEISIVPVVADIVYDSVLEVGMGAKTTGSLELLSKRRLYVYGEGWWGGVSQEAINGTGNSPLPFGPYTAACFAVGEVYKAARLHHDSYQPVSSAFYSTWFHKSGMDPLFGGPDTIPDIMLDVALAGVGAVGSMWLHTLWACPGLAGRVLLADNDKAGIDHTNLNRYPLFGIGSVGQPKASEAVRMCGIGSIELIPFDGPFEELTQSQIPPRVISAVDNNRARAAIQLCYPARLLSASTRDLRAEVLRCGPPGIGACLHCYNPIERISTDDEIRSHLAASSDEERTHLGAQARVSKEEMVDWIQTGRCGQASARLLPFIRQSGSVSQPEFAVSFVSAMAGTLLAAETAKDYFAMDVPLADELSRAVLQFWTPTAKTNGARAYKREGACSKCDPASHAVPIWNKRYVGLEPLRQSQDELASA